MQPAGQWSALGIVTGFHRITHKKSGVEIRLLEGDGSTSVARDPVSLFVVATKGATSDVVEKIWRLPRTVARVRELSVTTCGADVQVDVDATRDDASSPSTRPMTIRMCFLSPNLDLLPTMNVAELDRPASERPGPTANPRGRERLVLTPEAVGATSMNSVEAFPLEQRELIRAAAAELLRTGDNPAEFYATVTRSADGAKVNLWHRRAFLPENRGREGNPGGRCFTMYFDSQMRVSKKAKWQ